MLKNAITFIFEKYVLVLETMALIYTHQIIFLLNPDKVS